MLNIFRDSWEAPCSNWTCSRPMNRRSADVFVGFAHGKPMMCESNKRFRQTAMRESKAGRRPALRFVERRCVAGLKSAKAVQTLQPQAFFPNGGRKRRADLMGVGNKPAGMGGSPANLTQPICHSLCIHTHNSIASIPANVNLTSPNFYKKPIKPHLCSK
jgi:hypothetical protein